MPISSQRKREAKRLSEFFSEFDVPERLQEVFAEWVAARPDGGGRERTVPHFPAPQIPDEGASVTVTDVGGIDSSLSIYRLDDGTYEAAMIRTGRTGFQAIVLSLSEGEFVNFAGDIDLLALKREWVEGEFAV